MASSRTAVFVPGYDIDPSVIVFSTTCQTALKFGAEKLVAKATNVFIWHSARDLDFDHGTIYILPWQPKQSHVDLIFIHGPYRYIKLATGKWKLVVVFSQWCQDSGDMYVPLSVCKSPTRPPSWSLPCFPDVTCVKPYFLSIKVLPHELGSVSVLYTEPRWSRTPVVKPVVKHAFK